MSNRRSKRRWRSVLKGQIVVSNRSLHLNCTVRDLSEAGAKISLGDAFMLPPELELQIPSKGLRIQARLAWSQGATHGVTFIEPTKVWTDPIRTEPEFQ